jgi:hypothetical protein
MITIVVELYYIILYYNNFNSTNIVIILNEHFIDVHNILLTTKA